MPEVQLNWVDWMFIVGYCAVALLVGLVFTRRASKNVDEYFVGGRNFAWWVAGTSMVATTFAADTPLVVSGLARTPGIYGNWLWWSALMGGMMCVFFYARLWRRADVITDVEFIELRYSGKSAAVLRGFMAVYGGVLQNCIIMGWVMLAMAKICSVMLGWDKLFSLVVMLTITVFYTILSGFWGVVITDLVQFIMAMAGSIALAGVVLWKMGGPVEMVAQIRAVDGFDPKIFNFVPDWHTATKLALWTFFVQLSIQWWGGGQGGGYIAQRLFSTSSERDSALAALWFNFAHYVLRPWPWIIVGLASLVYFPTLPNGDPERAYPLMIAKFLPVGLRGLMVASLMAAFMSTMDTQLNWGASYLVNDLYKRFVRRNATGQHYVNVSRIAVVVLMGLGAITAWQYDSVKSGWIYLMQLTAGAGVVGLLRWYWWRVNPWSEIAALSGSFLIANGKIWANLVNRIVPIAPDTMARIEWLYSGDAYAVLFPIIVAACTGLWILVTFLTEPVPVDQLERFYRRVRPGGWWSPLAARCPDVVAESTAGAWVGWIAGVACIYAGLFGVGYLCLSETYPGLLWLLVSAIGGGIMIYRASRPDSNPQPQNE